MTAQPNRPFLPEDLPRRSGRRDTLSRAATAIVLHELRGDSHDLSATAKALFPGDTAIVEVVKAAVNPATTTSTPALTGPTIVASFLSGLAGRSAAATLFDRAIRVDMAGVNTITFPRAVSGLGPVFIAEGAPIPVAQGVLDAATLGPVKKMAVITALSGELESFSAGAAETIIRLALQDAAGKALDQALFSTAAASAIRPSGILAGVTPLTATAGGGTTAMAGDFAKLFGAMATAGLGTDVLLFANPAQVASASVHAPRGIEIIAAPTLAAGTIVGVDLSGFASGFSGSARIETSREGVLHFEGTSPLQISSPGTPPVVAAPTQSLYQTGGIALRVILPTAWSVVAPGAAAWISGATW